MRSSEIASAPSTPYLADLADDSLAVLAFAARSHDAGLGAALVTLVDIRGGAARALGSQMAVCGDGGYIGFVSGGCVEPTVATEALEAISKGGDRFISLGEGSRFFDIVLPCGGGVTLAIHVLRESRTIWRLLSELNARNRGGLGYNPGRQVMELSDTVSVGWHDDVFTAAYRPPVRLILCGRSIEVDATQRMGKTAGFDMIVADRDRPLPEGAIDQDTAVAILMHDIDREVPFLEAALAARPFYVGALGSGRTHAKRSDLLARRGHTAEDIAKIKAPIGLFPKARDASSLAISVLADIAARRG